MKETFTKRYLLVFVMLLGGVTLFAQPANYWSNSFNSEASLLGGAVVGGGSNITSIYYNPANIAEIKESNIAFNSSLFKLQYEKYDNAFGDERTVSNPVFKVEPRFASLILRPKKHPKLSWQMAVFSRDFYSLYLYDTYSESAKKLGLAASGTYSGSFNLRGTYSDYWAGLGASYQINDHLYMGFSLLGSLKNMYYTNRRQTVLEQSGNELQFANRQDLSVWSAYDWINFWDIRMLVKIGLRYKLKNTSFGLNLTSPSVKIMGYAHLKLEHSYLNIVDNQGEPIPDFIEQYAADYVYCQVKDPFSASFGITHYQPEKKQQFYFSTEFFAGLKPYKMIDPTRGHSLFADVVTDSPKATIYYGNKPILNIGFGYLKKLKPEFEIMFGFKTDFNSYNIPKSFIMDNSESIFKQYVSSDLYHLSGGANFIFLNKLKINTGLELTYGQNNSNRQFINFTDIKWYNPEDNTALQGLRGNEMDYSTLNIGLFFGFTYIFK